VCSPFQLPLSKYFICVRANFVLECVRDHCFPVALFSFLPNKRAPVKIIHGAKINGREVNSSLYLVIAIAVLKHQIIKK
jgi:hypothetical protein